MGDGCAADAHCLAYYYGDQQSLYGANALGQCVWLFDTPANCKAASASNPYNSGGHSVYGDWAAMTDHFCGDANGCGWIAGGTCRSGPWSAADDAACTPNSAPGFNLYKKDAMLDRRYKLCRERMFFVFLRASRGHLHSSH